MVRHFLTRRQTAIVAIAITPLLAAAWPLHNNIEVISKRNIGIAREAVPNTMHHVLISWGKEQRHTAQVRAHDHTVLAARRRLGYTAEELIGQPVYSLIPHHNPEDRHPSADQSQTNDAFTEQTAYRLTNEVFWRMDAYEELCLS